MKIRRKKIGSLRWISRIIFLWFIALIIMPLVLFTDACSVFIKKSPESYITSATKYTDKKDYTKALKNYTKAIELNPTTYQTYLDRANIEILIGDSLNKEHAIDDLGIYINSNESNPQSKELLSKAYFKRADIMLKLGYKSDACSDWKECENLNTKESTQASNNLRLYCK